MLCLIIAIAFSPDFQHLAVASMDGTLTILDYRTGSY
jgi:WD40 repeat protein